MTIDDATPDTGALTRRALRARTGAIPASEDPVPPFSAVEPTDGEVDAVVEAATEILDEQEISADATSGDDPFDDVPAAEAVTALEPVDGDGEETDTQWADDESPATALVWLDPADVAEATVPADLEAVTMDEADRSLLADAKTPRGVLRARWAVPLIALALLVLSYSGTMLFWPLHDVPPVVEAVELSTVPSETAVLTWPGTGSASVGVQGVSTTASTESAVPIASITKVVTSLMILDRLPLQPGETGPEYQFRYSDSIEYWDYLRSNQSALDVPVDGVLTEYQMLQGILLGSANNYVDRLARELWGSDAQFATAAATWLSDRGLTGITIVTPSGFDERNTATPAALVALGEYAMKNPVFAEIVGTAAVDLPGAGHVENTNGMLADEGVTGIKTGTLVGWNLLTSKDVAVGDTTVHLFASALNQDDDAQRLAVTRSLFAEVEAALAAIAPAVPAGTVVGEVTTPWGAHADVVTGGDATVVLWNGAAATAQVSFDLEDQRENGDTIGTATVTGPLNTVTVDVSLDSTIDGPSPWWRLTHPLELLGLDD